MRLLLLAIVAGGCCRARRQRFSRRVIVIFILVVVAVAMVVIIVVIIVMKVIIDNVVGSTLMLRHLRGRRWRRRFLGVVEHFIAPSLQRELHGCCCRQRGRGNSRSCATSVVVRFPSSSSVSRSRSLLPHRRRGWRRIVSMITMILLCAGN